MKLLPIPDKQILTYYYCKKGMTHIEISLLFNVCQYTVSQWCKKLNIKSREAKRRNQYGSNNGCWKGDNAGNKALHYRVQASRGKANKCEVCGKGRYFDWANLTGNYKDINDYKMMCKSCHAKYDHKGRKPKGAVLNETN